MFVATADSEAGSLEDVRQIPRVSDLARTRRKKTTVTPSPCTGSKPEVLTLPEPHNDDVVEPGYQRGVGVAYADTVDIEQLTARLQAACLETTQASQSVTEDNIAAALEALHIQAGPDTAAQCVTAKQAALHLLAMLARDPTNVHDLTTMHAVSTTVPLLQHERHTLRHAACQFLDILASTAARTPIKTNVDDHLEEEEEDGDAAISEHALLQVINSKNGRQQVRNIRASKYCCNILMQVAWDCGALPMLLRMLHKSAPTEGPHAAPGCLGCCQRAATLLYHITVLDPVARDQIIAGGGVEGLLRVLRYGGARPEAQHAAARLLLDMASATHALSEELVSCGAVPALDSVLCDTSASAELQFTAAAALKYMCDDPTAQVMLSQDTGHIQGLTRMLKSNNAYQQVAAARLLARLGTVIDLHLVIESGALEALCAIARQPSASSNSKHSNRRIMGHTPQGAAMLSVCQLLLPALQQEVSVSEKGAAYQKEAGPEKETVSQKEALLPEDGLRMGKDGLRMDGDDHQHQHKEEGRSKSMDAAGVVDVNGVDKDEKEASSSSQEKVGGGKTKGKFGWMRGNKGGSKKEGKEGEKGVGGEKEDGGEGEEVTVKNTHKKESIVHQLLETKGLLPLLTTLLTDTWRPFQSMAATLLAELASTAPTTAAVMAMHVNLVQNLVQLLTSDNPACVTGAARALAALAPHTDGVVGKKVLDNEDRLSMLGHAVQVSASMRTTREDTHARLLALLSLFDAVTDTPEALTGRRAWRLVSQGTLLRGCAKLLGGPDPALAQAAARIVYNIAAHRPSAVEMASMPGIVPGLLRVASAALDPPRPHSAPITPTEHETFNTQVQGASHTALCAIARLAAHAAPSCTSELLSGGVMPLLAALVGARDAPMILRRAALVALVDLCQGADEQEADALMTDREGPWGPAHREPPILAGTEDILLTAAREQLLIMRGMASLEALISDDEAVSAATAQALVKLLDGLSMSGRKYAMDHKYATMVRKHFKRNGKSIKA